MHVEDACYEIDENVCYEVDSQGDRHEVDMFGYSGRDSKYINSADNCEMETDNSSPDLPAVSTLNWRFALSSPWTRR